MQRFLSTRQNALHSQTPPSLLMMGDRFALLAKSLLLLLIVTQSAMAGELVLGDKALYASDDRHEVHQANQVLRRAARSVGAIMDADLVDQLRLGHWQLAPSSTGRDKGWCETERFIDQPTAASCTGFLIAPNRFATSAHCVQPADDPGAPGLSCANMSVVFGYAVDAAGNSPRNFAADTVYRCQKVLAGENDPTGSDWRVVELNKEVQGVDEATIYHGAEISSSWELAIIGHPNGLPAKVGTNAQVVDAANDGYFVTDLDSYVGNSGSPVFVEHEGQAVVVGLLSRGADDFEQINVGLNSCQQSRSCTTDSCGGEHVTPARVLQEFASRSIDSMK